MPDKDCCALPEGSPPSSSAACPACAHSGKPVDLQTVKAMLTTAAMRGLMPDHTFRFCANPDCTIVYFGSTQTFSQDKLRVPVFQKDFSPATPVCYCFGYSRGMLVDGNARKKAISNVGRLVKAGACACEIRNPQGSCCLGNVSGLK